MKTILVTVSLALAGHRHDPGADFPASVGGSAVVGAVAGGLDWWSQWRPLGRGSGDCAAAGALIGADDFRRNRCTPPAAGLPGAGRRYGQQVYGQQVYSPQPGTTVVQAPAIPNAPVVPDAPTIYQQAPTVYQQPTQVVQAPPQVVYVESAPRVVYVPLRLRVSCMPHPPAIGFGFNACSGPRHYGRPLSTRLSWLRSRPPAPNPHETWPVHFQPVAARDGLFRACRSRHRSAGGAVPMEIVVGKVVVNPLVGAVLLKICSTRARVPDRSSGKFLAVHRAGGVRCRHGVGRPCGESRACGERMKRMSQFASGKLRFSVCRRRSGAVRLEYRSKVSTRKGSATRRRGEHEPTSRLRVRPPRCSGQASRADEGPNVQLQARGQQRIVESLPRLK